MFWYVRAWINLDDFLILQDTPTIAETICVASASSTNPTTVNVDIDPTTTAKSQANQPQLPAPVLNFDPQVLSNGFIF